MHRKTKTDKTFKVTLVAVGMITCLAFLAVFSLAVPLWAQNPAPGAPLSFVDLAKKASPSVVNISTVKVIKGGSLRFQGPSGQNDPFNEFFERFFKDQIPREYRQRSLGTGFIIDKEGYIITNNHVVEKTDEIKVKLDNAKEFDARIVGRDAKTDLALIRIETDEDLVPLPLGDSEALEVGEWVLAIGNPFGLDHTVTAGIVSAKYRKLGQGAYENFIQTDASINPGNSGGPLLNTRGEVVGINAAIIPGGGGSVGIGFAIPINMARELLPQLKKGQVVRGWLGVMVQKITPELKGKLDLDDEKGALVADVAPDGPAARAGIERGDVIVSFDHKEIKEMNDLPFIVASTPVDKTVIVDLIRKGKKKSLKVKVGLLKEDSEPKTEPGEKSDLGMQVEEITPDLARHFNLTEDRGLVITGISGDSPAGEAGLRAGDVLLEIDQQPITNLGQYSDIIGRYKKGDTILFLVKRKGATLYHTLKIPG